MSIYNSFMPFTKGEGFSPATGMTICGFAEDQYLHGKTAQASVGSVPVNTLLPCTAVVITNDTTPATGTQGMKGFNPNSYVISKVVADGDQDVVSGFVLEGNNTLVDENGSGGLPMEGGRVNIGLIGSGTEVFLPCADDMIGFTLSFPVYWNPTTGLITKQHEGSALLIGASVVSSVVDGVKRKLNGEKVEWETVKCVKVRL